MVAPEDPDHTPRRRATFELADADSAIRGDQERKMHSTLRFRMVVLTLALAIASLIQLTPSYAQTQGSDRRQDRRDDRGDARDTKQTGREDARDAKAECKAGDEKSRAECRQDKRDIKQDSRDAARDIKKD